MWKKLKSQKFLLLQYLWCYWSKIDNFHFSTVCTMIPSNWSKSFPALTGHVTYRKLNHVWEHLNKWLLQRISLLFLPNYPQQVASVAMNRKKGSTWISGGIGRYMAVSDCRMSLTSSTIHRMVSGENLYLSYTSSSSRLSRVLLKSQNTRGRLIGIAFCLLRRRPMKMTAILLCLRIFLSLLFCRLKCLRIKQNLIYLFCSTFLWWRLGLRIGKLRIFSDLRILLTINTLYADY